MTWKKEAKAYAAKKSKDFGYEITYLETSAKTGETIKKVFTNLIYMMVEEAEISMKKKEKAKQEKKIK
ncbi:MAG: hypothetical protein HZR80_00570 [Candidatus Heimdallarchaeota archaeon]